MGACDFMVRARGTTAKEAFENALDEALHEYGGEERGYTGSVLEKHSFIMVSLGSCDTASEEPEDLAADLLQRDARLSDKWGPAGCVDLTPGEKGQREFLFFGMASS